MSIYIERGERQRQGLIAREEVRSTVWERRASVCDKVEAVFICRGRKGWECKQRNWRLRTGRWKRFQGGAFKRMDGWKDGWKNTCNAGEKRAFTAFGEDRDWFLLLTDTTGWIDVIPLPLSLLTLSLSGNSLTQFAPPPGSSSYFYILTGDNTLSSARPPLNRMLLSALLHHLHLTVALTLLSSHTILCFYLSLFYICLYFVLI